MEGTGKLYIYIYIYIYMKTDKTNNFNRPASGQTLQLLWAVRWACPWRTQGLCGQRSPDSKKQRIITFHSRDTHRTAQWHAERERESWDQQLARQRRYSAAVGEVGWVGNTNTVRRQASATHERDASEWASGNAQGMHKRRHKADIAARSKLWDYA